MHAADAADDDDDDDSHQSSSWIRWERAWAMPQPACLSRCLHPRRDRARFSPIRSLARRQSRSHPRTRNRPPWWSYGRVQMRPTPSLWFNSQSDHHPSLYFSFLDLGFLGKLKSKKKQFYCLFFQFFHCRFGVENFKDIFLSSSSSFSRKRQL